jgi:NhaP-type Na+/H+ or K+/H+ antiporter
MSKRIAAAMSLVVFAACLVAGLQADNTLSTTLWRALIGMGGTLLIGLVLGAMTQKMLDENLAARRKEAEEVAAAAKGNSGAAQEKAAATGIPSTKSAMKGR